MSRSLYRTCGVAVAVVVGALAGLSISGCQDSGRAGAGPSLFGPAVDTEKWTIRCCRLETPDHVRQAEMLANMLRKVSQLEARKVRVSSDATGSTIYYGEYHRVSSPTSGQLVFPPKFQQHIEFIRTLSSAGIGVPFFGAQPELVESATPSAHPEWEVSNAKSTHSLRIGMFYNTPTFTERKQAAEQYVALLRQDGFPAYYYHEPVKSYVFVGDFTASDRILTPEGYRPSQRVEQMIARRADEFRTFSENGFTRLSIEGNRKTAPLSEVVEIPRKDAIRIR
jgi:hypothetical protein